jgi:hypothetical protein
MTSVIVFVGLAVRFVLVPYLRDHLVQPVQEVKRQVTENSHANAEPTLPDLIDDVRGEVRALSRVLEGHMSSSDRWLDVVMDKLHGLERAVPAGKP